MDEFIGQIDIAPDLDPHTVADLLAWSHWVPCEGGCCLVFDGGYVPDDPVETLRRIIKDLRGYRFDGMVVGRRASDGRLFAISVTSNRVTERTLRPGKPALGRERRASASRPPGAVVVDLASRRA